MSGNLTIFLYHSVLPETDEYMPELMDAEKFARQLDIMGRFFNVLPLPEALDRIEQGTLPRRAASITFDDGYADNCEVAMPMLRQRGMHATFFIAAGYLDGGIMFNDIVRECVRKESRPQAYISFVREGANLSEVVSPLELHEALLREVKYLSPSERNDVVGALAESLGVDLPSDIMMTSEQVNRLASAGMEVGAHTMTHPILARLDAEEARREIVQSKSSLEDILGEEVRLFAYPNGQPGIDYKAEHVDFVRDAGFAASVTTSPGVAMPGTDRFQLPRFGPWSTSVASFLVNYWRNTRKQAKSL